MLNIRVTVIFETANNSKNHLNCLYTLTTRHEHGQKFALEAEVEIGTENIFLLRLGLRLSLTSKDSKELNQDWGVCKK